MCLKTRTSRSKNSFSPSAIRDLEPPRPSIPLRIAYVLEQITHCARLCADNNVELNGAAVSPSS